MSALVYLIVSKTRANFYIGQSKAQRKSYAWDSSLYPEWLTPKEAYSK